MVWKKKSAEFDDVEAIDWDDTPEFEGTLVGCKVVDTKYGEKNLYRFEDNDGEPAVVWGSATLDRALEDVEKGTRVRIEYGGMKKTKKGNRAHQFEVFVDDGSDDEDARPRKAKSAAKKSPAKAKPKAADDDEAY